MNSSKSKTFREKLYVIIFEADTPKGKLFDVALLWLIFLSVIIALLDSVPIIHEKAHGWLLIVEWCVTILFTTEYVLRIYSARKPISYIFSFFGIIDFLSILPTYLSLFIVGSHYLIVIRILRFLRIFRVLKMARYIGASKVLLDSMTASRHKIVVFLEMILTIVVLMGALMYIIEGPENGFTSIPRSIYWAIVTLTTVGYGDISPQTALGQTLASFVMIIGYAIIAVPTGIITAEITRQSGQSSNALVCKKCKNDKHDADAVFCKQCGAKLDC